MSEDGEITNIQKEALKGEEKGIKHLDSKRSGDKCKKCKRTHVQDSGGGDSMNSHRDAQ